MERRLPILATMWLVGCASLHQPDLTPTAALSCRSDPPSGLSIRWSAPDAGDRRRLDAWCAGVGPPLIRSMDNLSGRVSVTEVLFVSWNVHVGAGDIERLIGDLRAGRFPDGRPVRHFVLVLQEAVRHDGVPMQIASTARAAKWIGSQHATDVDEIARKLDLSVFYVPSMRNGFEPSRDRPASDRGNAILATFPLSDLLAIELPGARQRRVAIDASIPVDIEGRLDWIRVGSAHLNVLGAGRTLWIFGATSSRARQARALIHSVPDGLAVLGADVNSWEGSDERAVRQLLAAFPATPPSRVSTFRTGFVLDRVFFRLPTGWRARVTRARDRYGSDHYPVIGTISHF